MFIEKVRDIVGLYLDPPERAIVLCVDEKSQACPREGGDPGARSLSPILPIMPGTPEQRTHDYKRHGTTSLFAALDATSGKVIGKCYKRHRVQEFKKFLVEIEANVPENLDVHLIMDNYATHKTPAIRDWLARRPHWHAHFTPTSASWMNLVERFFGELTECQIRRGTHCSVKELEETIISYINNRNDDPKPFKWIRTADQILASIKRYCQRLAPRTYGANS